MAEIQLYVPVDQHRQLTGLSSEQKLTIPAGAHGVVIQAITQNVRYTMIYTGASAVPATASLGFQLRTTDAERFIPALPGQQVSIKEETASATVEYFYAKVVGMRV